LSLRKRDNPRIIIMIDTKVWQWACKRDEVVLVDDVALSTRVCVGGRMVVVPRHLRPVFAREGGSW